MPADVLHHSLTGPQDASVVVLSGSLGTTLEMWASQTNALSAERRVLAVDHRGHGGSPVPDGPYSIDDLGRDMLALLNRLELGRVDFVGLSLGGIVGLWLASEEPQRVERLAVCSSAAYLGPPDGWIQRAAVVREKGPGAIADAVMERFFSERFRSAHPVVVEAYHATLSGTAREGYAGCCEAIASADLRDRLGRITAETLVVTGDDDAVIPRERTEELLSGISSAREHAVAQAGHMASVEQPQAFTAAVREHLD